MRTGPGTGPQPLQTLMSLRHAAGPGAGIWLAISLCLPWAAALADQTDVIQLRDGAPTTELLWVEDRKGNGARRREIINRSGQTTDPG
jgi:hypothetical protein